jgi:hypothetical protein
MPKRFTLEDRYPAIHWAHGLARHCTLRCFGTTSAATYSKWWSAIAPLMPARSPWGDQRRMKHDGAKNDCAADACMLAHGFEPKRIASAALYRATTWNILTG